nr:DUF4232 domain-containing protein [Gordonia amarae]
MVLAAGCSSGTSDSTANTSAAPAASPAPAQTRSMTSTAPAVSQPSTTAVDTAAKDCVTADLQVSVTPDQGSAGHIGYLIGFTNTGQQSCSMFGYPGVSVVGGGNGTQIGQAADRHDWAHARVVVAPGATVTAGLLAVNIGDNGGPLADLCKVVDADGYRIYPPGNTAAAYVPQRNMKACSSDTHWLQVYPVTSRPLGH